VLERIWEAQQVCRVRVERGFLLAATAERRLEAPLLEMGRVILGSPLEVTPLWAEMPRSVARQAGQLAAT